MIVCKLDEKRVLVDYYMLCRQTSEPLGAAQIALGEKEGELSAVKGKQKVLGAALEQTHKSLPIAVGHAKDLARKLDSLKVSAQQGLAALKKAEEVVPKFGKSDDDIIL